MCVGRCERKRGGAWGCRVPLAVDYEGVGAAGHGGQDWGEAPEGVTCGAEVVGWVGGRPGSESGSRRTPCDESPCGECGRMIEQSAAGRAGDGD